MVILRIYLRTRDEALDVGRPRILDVRAHRRGYCQHLCRVLNSSANQASDITRRARFAGRLRFANHKLRFTESCLAICAGMALRFALSLKGCCDPTRKRDGGTSALAEPTLTGR